MNGLQGVGVVPGASEGKRLKGWKEIAGCLNVTTRTAQRWAEKFKLPVDAVCGKYEADEAELLSWKKEHTQPYTDYRAQVKAKGGQQRGNQWGNCVAEGAR
jgi:hypothetical protein